MTWKEFRQLTQDIPGDEEVYFEAYVHRIGRLGLTVEESETKANFTNDNTVILKIS